MDTPGEGHMRAGLLGKLMHGQMMQALLEAEGWVLVIDAHNYGGRDDRFLRLLARENKQPPLILALNKTDLLQERAVLFPLVTSLNKKLQRAGLRAEEIIPVSARTGYNIAQLKKFICAMLPATASSHLPAPVPSAAFTASELLREQLFRKLEKEVPFGLCVLCESLRRTTTTVFIGLVILVSKENHKPIILGHKGARMKTMASAARRAMERVFGKKVMLEVRVRTQKNWRGDASLLSRAVLDSQAATTRS